jgi:hypothetical protein
MLKQPIVHLVKPAKKREEKKLINALNQYFYRIASCFKSEYFEGFKTVIISKNTATN